jgi:hypothetical protein
MPNPSRSPRVIATAVVLLLVGVMAAPALAHEEEKEIPARTLSDWPEVLSVTPR